ncbi:hypothetical protein GCM10009680_61790 [Streptomyces yatensis]|uniref:Transposase n=1 Tax=Streptomyces yatensis TaxID=155177 RepID=A0ABN2IV11_9ACTN
MFSRHGLTRRHVHRTQSFTVLVTEVAIFLGCHPGSRPPRRMSISPCEDTLLRLIRALSDPEPVPVPVLGVDRFVMRRRRTYATMGNCPRSRRKRRQAHPATGAISTGRTASACLQKRKRETPVFALSVR